MDDFRGGGRADELRFDVVGLGEVEGGAIVDLGLAEVDLGVGGGVCELEVPGAVVAVRVGVEVGSGRVRVVGVRVGEVLGWRPGDEILGGPRRGADDLRYGERARVPLEGSIACQPVLSPADDGQDRTGQRELATTPEETQENRITQRTPSRFCRRPISMRSGVSAAIDSDAALFRP